MQYRESVGCYQVDETQGDIYLVSKWDRSKVIGRPNVYLAIDTASGLIAGVYVGLDTGETALMACIANAAGDKAAYCAAYGIDLSPADWPNRGLPSEIISDRAASSWGTESMSCASATASTGRRSHHSAPRKSPWWREPWT